MSQNPYQPSAEPVDQNLAELPAAVEPFVSASARAMAVLVLFAGFAVVLLLEIGAEFYSLGIARRMQAEIEVPDREFALLGLIALGVNVLRFVAYLATVVAYLIWLHRAYRNLPALGARDLQYTPRSAVLWWFCPLANLVVPFRVVRETWQASDAASYQAPGGWKSAPTSILLNFWWASWLISLFVINLVSRVSSAAATPDGYIISSVFNIFSCALFLLATLLAALVVRRIDLFQRRGEANVYAAYGAV